MNRHHPIVKAPSKALRKSQNLMPKITEYKYLLSTYS